MNATKSNRKPLKLVLGTAMAAAMLAGCASSGAPRADLSASAAQRELDRGRSGPAVEHAEAAVLADPHNAAYRMVLGNAYLEAGRFASAEAAFADAMALGDNSPRAALSRALSQIAQAEYAPAAALLNDWESQIAPADLGLALALAGQPERGIHIMSNAIRGGENTLKMRQNLAYAYAMAGRWREARLMAAQDLPAGEVGDRMQEWAELASGTAYQQRIASLLDVPVGVPDGGMPVQLALANNPTVEQLAAQAMAPLAASPAELPALAAAPAMAQPAPIAPLAAVEPATAPAGNFEAAFAASPVPATAQARYVSNPLVQAAPSARASATTQPVTPVAERTSPAIARSDSNPGGGSHLVQLGSFLSEQGARRAWSTYLLRYPELADQELVLTQAMVNGRRYWRVSAGGFDRQASRAMCTRVRASSRDGCISWAAASPLPGAVDTGLRLARR